VVSTVGGVDCRLANGTTTGTCTAQVSFGTTVTLRATTTDTVQVSASGGCTLGGTPNAPQLTCVMDQPRTVGFTFTAPPKALNVSAATSSSGTGQVTSQAGLAPAINCLITGTSRSNACTQVYPVTTQVTLTATPTNGAKFTGWGGDCSASGTTTTCTVAMSAARNVTASFAPSLKATLRSTTANPDIVTSTVLVDVTSDGGTVSGLSADVAYTAGQPSGYIKGISFDQTVSPAVLTLTVDQSALPAGTFTATVTVRSTTSGVTPTTLNIVTTVRQLLYYKLKDQTPTAPTGTVRFDIGSLGGTAGGLTATVQYDAGQPAGYFTPSLDRTSTPAVLSLAWNSANVPVGSYTSTTTISSTTPGFAAVQLRITFNVFASASQTVVAQLNVVSSVPVAGALPSIQVIPRTATSARSNPR
jgi:hypothetical protein